MNRIISQETAIEMLRITAYSYTKYCFIHFGEEPCEENVEKYAKEIFINYCKSEGIEFVDDNE